MLLALALAIDLATGTPAHTQATPDDLSETPQPMQTVQVIDAAEQARAAAARGDMAEALSRYLRVLAAKPDDVAALIGAGRAALAVGDLNAANGFFARADSLSPNNGAVKAGIGSILVQQGDARGALRYFRAASQAGTPEAQIAGDRGLAYDLRGDPRRAQTEYAAVLRDRPGDPVTLRRLALSQAIGGEQAAALATLDPLLRRQDVPAWRTRMFVRALTGDVAGAEADAPLVLPAPQVAALTPYLAQLAALKPADKAAAVFLGRFPALTRVGTAAPTASPRPTIALAPTVRPAQAASVPSPQQQLNSFSLPPSVPGGGGASAQGAASGAPSPAAPATVTAMAAVVSSSAVVDAKGRRRAPTAPARASVRPSAMPPGVAAQADIASATSALPGGTSAEGNPARADYTAQGTPAAIAAAPMVDTGTIARPAAPTAAERKVALAEARAETAKAARDKQAATAKAARDRQAAEAKAALGRNPERHWVQLAGGANRATLPREWQALKARYGGALAGRSPWTMHYRYTNRLMIGPFASAAAAQDWVNDQRTKGITSFRVTTEAGTKVEPVDPE